MKAFLATLVVVLLLISAWQWRDWAADPVAAPPTPADVVMPPPVTQPASLAAEVLPANYVSVVERPLFQPDRRPPEPPEASAAAEEPPPPEELPDIAGVDVSAIVIAPPETPSVWLLDPRVAPTAERYRLGESFQGWSIAEIGPDFVDLKGQGQTERLPLLQFSVPAQLGGAPGVQRPPLRRPLIPR